MTRIEFDCDRCGARVSGLHTPSGTAGFYVMDDGAFAKYRRDRTPPEHFVCDACVQSMPEYQAVYGKPGESA